GLLTHAVQQVGKTRLRLALAAADVEAEQGRVRITVTSGGADAPDPDPDLSVLDGDAGRPLGLAMVERIVGLMGGELAAERDARGARHLVVELRFSIDRASLALPLDLAHLPALIVTKDQRFV